MKITEPLILTLSKKKPVTNKTYESSESDLAPQ